MIPLTLHNKSILINCVILAKNEEKYIASCIESVLDGIRSIPDTDIFLVDSCSSDRTVEIAKQYPINIIGLRETWMLSPAAGRYCGIRNSAGKYVLIIDGDMELRPGWLEKAIDYLEENPQTSAVVGEILEVYEGFDGNGCPPVRGRSSRNKKGIQRIPYIYESSVFRRSAIDAVGNFHPFLRAEEEAEISCRFAKMGFNMVYLPIESIYHHCIRRDTFRETSRRWRHELIKGIGDMASWALRHRCFAIFWRRFSTYILFIGMVLTSLIGFIVSLLGKHGNLVVLFASIPFLFALFMIVKKGGVSRGLLSVFNISLHSLSVLQGVFRKIPGPDTYPTDVEWIKRQ